MFRKTVGPDRRSKRGEYQFRIVRRKTGRQGHVHGIELVFRKKYGNWFHIFLRSYEFSMNFQRLNPFLEKEDGRGEPGLDTWQHGNGPRGMLTPA